MATSDGPPGATREHPDPREEYRGAPAPAIRHHYDLSNEFYALWLDSELTYSCAMWEPGDSLESAQRRKLDYLVEGARAVGADRVLDVGCGWGSLLRRLTQRHGVGRAVGLTLSAEQAEWVERLELPGCDVRLENWVDHPARERYDAVISIGAIEHFARYGLPAAERIAAYREFFTRCRAWLRPGGRLALQTNVKGNNPRVDRKTAQEMIFISKIVFPDSEIPRTSELLQASERLFDPVSARNDPDHYARTAQDWYERLRANRDAAVGLVGASRTADYERYLGAVAEHFRRRHIGLLRIVFEAV